MKVSVGITASDAPLMHDREKSANDAACNCLGIQLTYACDEHRPSYTAQKPVYVGVDRAP